jgi:hypothetical protein
MQERSRVIRTYALARHASAVTRVTRSFVFATGRRGGRRACRDLAGETQVWESSRALCLVGQPQDLDDVDRYARSTPHMSERVRQQAETTAQAIRQREAP